MPGVTGRIHLHQARKAEEVAAYQARTPPRAKPKTEEMAAYQARTPSRVGRGRGRLGLASLDGHVRNSTIVHRAGKAGAMRLGRSRRSTI